MEYVAYLHKNKKSDYGVSFPDFPGCITAGKTLDEARRFAQEALELHIAGMMEDEEDIPSPSVLDHIKDSPDMKDAIAFMVSVNPPSPTIRINLTLRENQLGEIDRAAKIAGTNRSAFMVQASIEKALGRQPTARF